MTDLQSLQKAIYQNKLDKGFNVTDVCKEFCYAQGELSEAFHAYTKHKPDVGEELADVAIYLFGLAEILGVDLGFEIERKVDINRRRRYVVEGDGWRKELIDTDTEGTTDT